MVIMKEFSKQHIALYRKYRPETFSDVVGQEQLVTLLESAIKQKKIAHAYLFCGSRGTGKTTVARIFARDIGCNPEDIIEIDAASNRGIDEIRELREAVRTAPFSSPYKVYIVDEAHMLTGPAANALLKTLEEPPSHVVFILATTDPDKLPQTIVSRCQKVIFKQPDIKTLTDRLTYVAEKEGKKLDEKAGELLAHHGNGSYRDALGLLEQILAVSSKSIKEEDVVALLGTPDNELLLILLKSVCMKDAKKIFETCEELKRGSSSALNSYDAFLEMVRQGLIARIGEVKDSSTVSTHVRQAGDDIAKLGKEYAYTINSKMILELLEKRHFLEISDAHAWAAFMAIVLSMIEI